MTARVAAGGSEMSESTALILFDRLDNALIEAELAGRAVQTWAYQFKGDDGKMLSGLSVTGVEEASRLSAMRGEAFRIVNWDVVDEGDAYRCVIEVGRFAVKTDTGEAILLDTALGSKREMKTKVRRSGGYYEDKNAFDVAMSKAARNAKLKLMDPQIRESVLASAMASGRVQTATPRDARRAEHAQRREAAPPPADKVAEDQARARFFAAVDELGMKSQAEYHGRLGLDCTGKRHDVDRKDPAFCNALRDSVMVFARENKVSITEAWEEHRRRLLATGEPEPEPTLEELESG